MRIGIIGAGQLGQMLGRAAADLGHECRFLDPADDPPAATAGAMLRAAYDDAAALKDLAAGADVVTYEFENVPVDALAHIAADTVIYPPPEALRRAQDRLSEKQLFEELGIPLAPYRVIDDRAALDAAVADLGFPLVLKTRRFGYDGKGQVVIRTRDDIAGAWQALGGRPLVAEAWVPFDFEVSVIGARARDGSTRTWPLTRNRHADGILRTSVAPEGDAELAEAAGRYVGKLMTALDYVGVIALELFASGNSLLANEFAPRVHNSGHWTIEGAATSQFANHIRAITGATLGPTDVPGFAAMVNLIGSIPDPIRALDDPHVKFYDYGKAPRPGRKLGHVTISTDAPGLRDQLLRRVEALAASQSALSTRA